MRQVVRFMVRIKRCPFPHMTARNIHYHCTRRRKKSNELIAHTYSHLFGLKTTGLRFFTVYGPWGRPDMALFQFADAIINDKPIQVFNNGDMLRDFTFVDDVVESIYRLTQTEPTSNVSWDALQPDPATSKAPYRVYNIGNHSPVSLMDYIGTLEKLIGKEAEKNIITYASW